MTNMKTSVGNVGVVQGQGAADLVSGKGLVLGSYMVPCHYVLIWGKGLQGNNAIHGT